MKRVRPVLAWALCALLAACADEEGPPPPLPQSRLNSSAPSTPPPTAPAQPTARRPQWPQARPTSAVAAPESPEVSAQDEKAEVKPPRDMPAELLQQLSDAPACLKPRPQDESPSRLRIALSAVVSPMGRVTRSEATSAQLRTEELRCLQDRVEAVRFATPIEDAPTTVRATLELQLAPNSG